MRREHAEDHPLAHHRGLRHGAWRSSPAKAVSSADTVDSFAIAPQAPESHRWVGQLTGLGLDDQHIAASGGFEILLATASARLVVGDGGRAGDTVAVGPGERIVLHRDRHVVIFAADTDNALLAR